MRYLRLSDEDRERFGVQEWLPVDGSHLTVAEAEALEVAGGDWMALDEPGLKATRCRIWLALHRAGVDPLSLADLDPINLAGMRARDEAAGKASADSATDESPTSPTSASSTRRSPRKRSSRSA